MIHRAGQERRQIQGPRGSGGSFRCHFSRPIPHLAPKLAKAVTLSAGSNSALYQTHKNFDLHFSLSPSKHRHHHRCVSLLTNRSAVLALLFNQANEKFGVIFKHHTLTPLSGGRDLPVRARRESVCNWHQKRRTPLWVFLWESRCEDRVCSTSSEVG